MVTTLALLGLALGVVWERSRTEAEYAPLARCLAALTFLNAAYLLLAPLHPPRADLLPHPPGSAARWAMRGEVAVLVLWPGVVAAATAETLLGSARWGRPSPGERLLLGWLAAALACGAAYPLLRQQPLAWAYVAARHAGVAVAGLAWLKVARLPRGPEVPALALSAGCSAQLFATWLGAQVRWDLAGYVTAATYTVVILSGVPKWNYTER